MFGFIWTGFTVATFILPALIGSELLTDVGFPLIGAAILAGVLIDVLITIGDRSSEHISVPSWFFLIALVAFISGSAVDALTNLSGATQAEWVGERVSTSWVLLAMMFGVAYHIAGSVVQRPLWSGSMTKASMVLLVVSIPPFLLAPLDEADVQEGSLLPSLAAILVTLGVLPLAPAGANLLATLRKDVGATSSRPCRTHDRHRKPVLMPLFAIGGMFMGTASMIGILGNSAHGAAASSIDDGFLWTVGGLICLGSFGYILPEISNRPLVDRNGLRWAVWLVAGGGIGMTVLSLMADFTTVAISGVNLDAALVTLAETDGFMLDDDATTDGLAAGPRVLGPWYPCRRVPVACGCDDVRGVRRSPLQSQCSIADHVRTDTDAHSGSGRTHHGPVCTRRRDDDIHPFPPCTRARPRCSDRCCGGIQRSRYE